MQWNSLLNLEGKTEINFHDTKLFLESDLYSAIVII